jgi:uncharacterized protein involved in type VI secretion and phage assembly
MTQSTVNAELSFVEVLLNGAPQTNIARDNLLDVLIEQDLFLPDSCTLRIADVHDEPSLSAMGYYEILDADTFSIGATLIVKLGHEETPTEVFNGEITSVELDANVDTYPVLSVRALDRSHRMRRQRKTRAFVNMSDASLARQIAGEYGLSPQVGTAATVYEHIFQDNQSDWDFLRARAARIGFDMFARGTQLFFKPIASDTTTVQVKHGDTLYRVRVRMSAQSQVSQVTVAGWDPKTKQALVGVASTPSHAPQVGETRTGASMSASFGTGKYAVAERTIASQGEANARAQAIYDRIAGDFIQVDGTCEGKSSLRPGRTIDIQGIGTRLSGKYYVSSVVHRRRRGEPYVSTFQVNGRRPSTLAGSLDPTSNQGGTSAELPALHASVVIGIVTDNKDPEQLGRVKVKFPWMDAASGGAGGVTSTWARVAAPMAGSGRGFVWLPEVNDEVLVAFEHGDINRPFVIGAVWNGVDKPPVPSSGALVNQTGQVDRRFIKTRAGHMLLFDDSQATPGVTVETKSGHSIKIDDTTASPNVTVKTNAGHKIVLDDATATSGVSIVDRTGNNIIKIASTTNQVQVKSAGTLTLEATGPVNITGASINVEARGTFNVKGALGTVQATGPLAVKGAIVNIN